MTHFQNNNTPSQAFSHNKESKGRPVYFSFYALHLSEWPELVMQMPAICFITELSQVRMLWVPKSSSSAVTQADKTCSGCRQGGWWRHICGVLCYCGAEPNCSKEKCLEQGRGPTCQQDPNGRTSCFLSAILPEMKISSSFFVFVFLFLSTAHCSVQWEKTYLKTHLTFFGSDPPCSPQVKALMWHTLSNLPHWKLQNIREVGPNFKYYAKQVILCLLGTKQACFSYFMHMGLKTDQKMMNNLFYIFFSNNVKCHGPAEHEICLNS